MRYVLLTRMRKPMVTLYDYLDSGNGYKIRLLLAQLGKPYRWIERDILSNETRTPEFLAKNPNGRIPMLELADGTCLAESNAIAWYLAEGSPFVPDNRLQRAQVLQWMFFEQYSHEPPERMVRGRAALTVMETHLARQSFFVGEAYSLADIALYAYTHVAHEAHFDLGPFQAVRRWLERVASQPGYLPLTQRPA
jgi:glutathione S-transferase